MLCIVRHRRFKRKPSSSERSDQQSTHSPFTKIHATAQSEHEVQRALDKLVARKCQTVILIAHRLSTVRTADQIVVLDKGMAVEKGKHEDLMLKKGVYSRLIARQLNA